MRRTFVDALADEAVRDGRIFGIVADIGTFTFDRFKECCPDRFLNVGIAECHMIGMAAGLALEGRIPVVYTIAPFLTARAFEPIRVLVSYQDLNVKLVGCGSGYAYSTLGPTHHATDDIALMRSLPKMTVVCPADPREVRLAVRAILEHRGPVYLRIGRDGEPSVSSDRSAFTLGRAATIRDGRDVAILGTGTALARALDAATVLAAEGIDVRVVNIHTIKPIDARAVLEAAKETRGILTLEEHSVIGGLGSAVAEILAGHAREIPAVPFRRMGLADTFCQEFGAAADLDRWCGLTAADVACATRSLLTGL